jgi:hypothetical protein
MTKLVFMNSIDGVLDGPRRNLKDQDSLNLLFLIKTWVQKLLLIWKDSKILHSGILREEFHTGEDTYSTGHQALVKLHLLKLLQELWISTFAISTWVATTLMMMVSTEL